MSFHLHAPCGNVCPAGLRWASQAFSALRRELYRICHGQGKWAGCHWRNEHGCSYPAILQRWRDRVGPEPDGGLSLSPQSGWAGRPPLCDGLTEREREVLAMIGEGCSNKEITRRLCISEKTVKNHVANVFSKLHVCDPTQAALCAIRKGLVKV